MMRRLLLLCLALTAFLPLLPAAHAAHRHAAPMCAACPASGDHDTDGAAGHACLGCATEPDAPVALARPIAMRAPAPADRLVATPRTHRPGFDPPPPRVIG